MESNLKTPVKSSKTKTPSTPQSPQTPGTDKSVQRRVNDILVGFHKCVQTWETDKQASTQLQLFVICMCSGIVLKRKMVLS